jgi:hypothetical protein
MPPSRPGVVQAYFAGGVPRAVAGRQVIQRFANGSVMPLPDTAKRLEPGHALPPPVRQKMEAVFGTSFADVRVHVDARPASIGALACTEGSHIHFAPGQYNPMTAAGQQILGHELAHVVQQRAGRVRNPFGASPAVVQDRMLDAEAARMARAAATPFPATLQRMLARPGGRVVQRNETYEEIKGEAILVVDDSKLGEIRATASDKEKPSKLDYKIKKHADEVEIGVVFSNRAGSGSAMMYHLALIAEKNGINTMHATNTAPEAYAEYRKWAFTPDPVGVQNWVNLGIMDPERQIVADWYANVADVKNITSKSFFTYWKVKTLCFLTTACTSALGLPDDCRELTVLRRFRDTTLAETAEGRALIAEYAQIAPRIVEAIDDPAVYDWIYDVIRECVDAIDSGQPQRAVERYRVMVLALADTYFAD